MGLVWALEVVEWCSCFSVSVSGSSDVVFERNNFLIAGKLLAHEPSAKGGLSMAQRGLWTKALSPDQGGELAAEFGVFATRRGEELLVGVVGPTEG